MRRSAILGAALLAALAAAPVWAQENFGTRFQGGPYKTTVFVTNASCPGTHSVQLTVQSAPWLRITGANPVTVSEGETVIVDAELNLNATPFGARNGTIQYTCLTCKPPCQQSVTTQAVTVTVLERTPTFNGALHPGDNQFGGLDAAGQPRNICDLTQGQAFDLKLINRGSRAVRFAGEGLVVEPLRKEAVQAAEREFTKLARGFTTARINGYCLDQALLPPSTGMMFRLAPANVQKQFASVKHLLQSARKLNSEGLFRPDSNPAAYLDFIKQWSVWTEREKWSQNAFVDKWIEHTRKQAAGAGRTLTGADEKTLRTAAPNRWRDISAVIAEAARRQGQ